ncbi:MAG: hypothetical protein KME13_21605 [Myxacorys californica WJT36-NPBG1]|jgi:CO/xanthine dehydrogenase Mo-binding subunit|nr:hypothetical protein [Myxacorys californica WJT36-NPBG1]
MANTLNIQFYNQLLASMLKSVQSLRGIVDRKEAEKAELKVQLIEAHDLLTTKDATIANLNGQIAQMQTGLESEEQAALVELTQGVEALNEEISAIVAPTSTAPETPAEEVPVEAEPEAPVEAVEEAEEVEGFSV